MVNYFQQTIFREDKTQILVKITENIKESADSKCRANIHINYYGVQPKITEHTRRLPKGQTNKLSATYRDFSRLCISRYVLQENE